MVLRAGRTCTKSFVFNGSFSTSQNMQYVNSCCQNPPKTLNAKDLFRFIGVLSALLFFKKDGANGAGTRFDQSPPPAAERKPKTCEFLARGIRKSVLRRTRQDRSYPPPGKPGVSSTRWPGVGAGQGPGTRYGDHGRIASDGVTLRYPRARRGFWGAGKTTARGKGVSGT